MGMSVSKILMSINELGNQIRTNSIDIWEKLYKFNKDPEPPSFQFKPFVVGFGWISSLDL